MVYGDSIFVSGQLALNKAAKDTKLIGEGDVKQETEQVLSNLKDVLTLAGSRLSSVVQVTAYLTDMTDYAAFNEVYGRYFSPAGQAGVAPPARVCVQVAKLPLNGKVEVACFASKANIPRPVTPGAVYSDSEVIGDLVHVSGQVAIDKAKAAKGDRTLVGAGDITKESEQALANLAACLERAGATQVLTATCYLTDMNDYAAFNEVYKKFFSARGVTELPARACFAVVKLPFGAKVEVSCVASLKKSTALTPGVIYSDAQIGPFIYVAGQVPIDKPKFAQGDKSLVGAGDITKETEQVLSNLRDVLTKAGSSLSHVVQATCYLTDMNNYAGFNAVYSKYFAAPRPARVCVQVGKLPLGAIVEVECVAVAAGGKAAL